MIVVGEEEGEASEKVKLRRKRQVVAWIFLAGRLGAG